MDMTNKEYGQYVNAKSKSSPSLKNCLWAFCVGGLICTLGQLLLICLSAILTGLGVFDKIAKHAGAGTLVPITGFANAVVSPALEFKSEGLVTGVAAKMFVIAGPVLVFGISASVVYGILLQLFGLA